MDPTPQTGHVPSVAFLSQITTIWSNIQRAQGGPDLANCQDWTRFFNRYHRSISNYLLRCVHQEEVASDLFQEFALRFLRGDFAQARSQTGSFRKYLKSALLNLVRDHFKQNARRAAPLPLQDWPQSHDEFDHALRDDLLSQVWGHLQQAESEGGPPFFTALRARADHSEWTAVEIAAHLAEVKGLETTSSVAAIRKLVQRAREAFAADLLTVTHQLLDQAPWEEVAEELTQLGLKKYCEKALEERIRITR